MKKIKNLFLKIFDRKNKFISFLSIIFFTLYSWSYIRKISLKYSFLLLPRVIYGKYFYEMTNFSQIKLDKVKYFEQKYKFSYLDMFTGNLMSWNKIIPKNKNIDYLEIGCFEGRSTVFIGEYENINKFVIVDTFGGSDEHKNREYDFKLVYDNFSSNIKKLKKDIDVNICTSDMYFEKNTQEFDIIYIDGSHHYENVKKDFVNSYNRLRNNGILICDDFFWNYYDDYNLNPMKAILECYDLYKNNLKILFINQQIFFKKII